MNVLVFDDWAMEKFKRKMIVFAFAAGLCSIPGVGFAQAKENDEKSLQGKWTLEKVSAFDEDVEIIPFNVDSICCVNISTEIVIQEDEVTFALESGEYKVTYEKAIRKNVFYYPHFAGWKIVDSKLQLHWGQDVNLPTGGTIIRTIVLTYKLNENE